MDAAIALAERTIQDVSLAPRSEHTGGYGQLKYDAKKKIPHEVVVSRKYQGVLKQMGPAVVARAQNKFKDYENLPPEENRKLREDEFLSVLLGMGWRVSQLRAILPVGQGRLDRINKFGPAIVRTGINSKALKDEDISRVIRHLFMQDLEPGYPCVHQKRLPLYVTSKDGSKVEWAKLHTEYSMWCKTEFGDETRILSLVRYREYINRLVPSVKLGKKKTDMCDQCYALDIQLKNPDLNEEERKAIKEELESHLMEAIEQRREMNVYIRSVLTSEAAVDTFDVFEDDGLEDEILNEALRISPVNPVLQRTEERIEQGDSQVMFGTGDFASKPRISSKFLTEQAKKRLAEKLCSRSVAVDEDEQRNVKNTEVEIQDYGGNLLLPFFSFRQPSRDYYSSKIVAKNMNTVRIGSSNDMVSLYDERMGKTDSESVSSVRLNNLQAQLKVNISNEKDTQMKILFLDNCAAQNKSSTVFKYFLFESYIYEKGIVMIFLKRGHTHNASDQLTSKLKKKLEGSPIFDLETLAERFKDEKTDVNINHQFYELSSTLDKAFNNMPSGFQNNYVFKLNNGQVEMKRSVRSKDPDVKMDLNKGSQSEVKKLLMESFFRLPASPSKNDIAKAKIFLPLKAANELTVHKKKSLASLMELVPKQFHDYYFPGESRSAEQNITDEEPTMPKRKKTKRTAQPTESSSTGEKIAEPSMPKRRPAQPSKSSAKQPAQPTISSSKRASGSKKAKAAKKQRGYKFHAASSNLDLDMSISSSDEDLEREMEEELRIDDELEADIHNPTEE